MALQDLIMQRAALQHQNMLNSDNVGIALSALANGASQGMIDQTQRKNELQDLIKRDAIKQQMEQQQAQAEMQQRKELFDYQQRAKNKMAEEERKANLARSIAMLKELKTNGGVLSEMANPDSGMKIKRKYDIINNDFDISLEDMSYSEQQDRGFNEAVKSGMSADELRRSYPKNIAEIDQLQLSGALKTPIKTREQQQSQLSVEPQVAPVIQQGGEVSQNVDGIKYVPKGFDALGRVTGYEPENKPTALVNKGIDRQTGQEMSIQNMDLVTGALRNLSETYKDAYAEGGMGNKLREYKSGVAGWMGGDIGDKFTASNAFDGLKTEVVARMMPLLTQQGDKAGSVRLVETIFKKVEKTLPDKNTGPKTAIRMMGTTIENMYRLSRAAQRIGFTNEQAESMTDDKLNVLSEKIAEMAQTIELTDKEKAELNQLVESVVAPISEMQSAREELKRRGLIQ